MVEWDSYTRPVRNSGTVQYGWCSEWRKRIVTRAFLSEFQLNPGKPGCLFSTATRFRLTIIQRSQVKTNTIPPALFMPSQNPSQLHGSPGQNGIHLKSPWTGKGQ